MFSQRKFGNVNPPLPEARMEMNTNYNNNDVDCNGDPIRPQGPTRVITIPVVVHLLYNSDEENVPVAQIQSQIDVLNEDFRRLNSNADDTWPQAGDAELEFELSEYNPEGFRTNGITRTYTDSTVFRIPTSIKDESSGGISPWDSRSYLTIYVCGISGLLGFATAPGGQDSIDGIAKDYKSFGRGDAYLLRPGSNLGRVGTHEVGYWLRLRHI